MNNLPIYAVLYFPLLLLGVAWGHHDRRTFALLVLTLSAGLIVAASFHRARWVLLGPDYSHRLYATIGANMFAASLLAIYLAIRRSWIAAFAGLVLLVDWLYIGAVNSAI